MKNQFFIAITIILFLPIRIFADNPIVTHIYTADPAALVSNGVFYIYCGHDEAPEGATGFNMWNWHILSSTDMVNWTDHGAVLSINDFSWANANAWAGHCVEKNGTYYWYVPAQNINGDHGWMGIGVATSNSPTGPFTDARGSALITSQTPTAEDMLNIDPAVFIDDDGAAYIYWGSWSQLRMARLQDNMIELAETPRVVNAYRFFEAAWVHKRNGIYYLSYSAGSNPATIEYCTSNSPYGPWTYRGMVNNTVYNSPTNHQSIVEYQGQWYFVYHNGLAPGGGEYRRSVCIDYLYYNSDGTMQEVVQTVEGVDPVGSCDPTTITPYIQIDGGSWEQTASVSVSVGSSVKLGPRPSDGGSWTWSGPNGFSASTREVTIDNIQTSQAGTYVTTYTNDCGANSTQNFNVSVGSSGDANIALFAAPSTSYVSSWETLEAVNDGIDPAGSTDNSNGAYGNWNGEENFNTYNYVQYDWTSSQNISSTSVFWWDDGLGIDQPTDAYIQYYSNGSWITAGNIGTALDQYNTLSLNITTTSLRIYMISAMATGILEWKVMGSPVSSNFPLSSAIDVANGNWYQATSLKSSNNVAPGNFTDVSIFNNHDQSSRLQKDSEMEAFIYPNPVTNNEEVTIDLFNLTDWDNLCEIINVQGQVVYSKRFEGNTLTIKTSEMLNPGIYWVWVKNSVSGKMLKLIIN